MKFFEIYINGKRYTEDGKPVVAFDREEADRIALDLMAESFFNEVEVRPVFAK